jgi:hypothetical protein
MEFFWRGHGRNHFLISRLFWSSLGLTARIEYSKFISRCALPRSFLRTDVYGGRPGPLPSSRRDMLPS